MTQGNVPYHYMLRVVKHVPSDWPILGPMIVKNINSTNVLSVDQYTSHITIL